MADALRLRYTVEFVGLEDALENIPPHVMREIKRAADEVSRALELELFAGHLVPPVEPRPEPLWPNRLGIVRTDIA